jgi:outer membrane lipoprotein-sorting protein
MRMSRKFFLGSMLFCASAVASAQQSPAASAPPAPTRDPQAVQVLAQALNAAGGVTALTAIQDYTASGTVNYYWGDGEQGTVVVKGRGTGQFRVDATLPEGVRSWAISNGSGWVKETDGRTDVILTHNAEDLGSLTFPFTFLSSALQDPSMSLVYVGLETAGGIQVHHVRAQMIYAQNADPTGLLAKLSKREFFIDATSFRLVSSEDMAHTRDNATVGEVRKVQFSDYRQINGILVPFSIAESIQGQQSETIQINQINFNTGLQDSTFAQ